MKTILIAASYSRSLVNFRGPLIKEMLKNGHRVHVCAPKLLEDQETLRWLEQLNVRCHNILLNRTGLNPFGDLLFLISMYRLMRSVRPNVFFGYTIKVVIWGIFAAYLAGVPKRIALITGLGYSFMGQMSGLRLVVNYVARILYRGAIKYADLVFFQNPDDKNDFLRLGILSTETPAVIVNGSGVDTDHFNFVALNEKPTRFLLVARLLGDKGIREFVAAAHQLSVRWPSAEFHLVGGLDSGPNGISKAEAESWTSTSPVIWHGAMHDIRSAVASCHVYVLPSYREGTPRTVLEAMSIGRAIVTTDAPGCRETVINGQNGFLVEPGDISSLVQSMERFLVDPALIQTMGTESRHIAVEKYDVKKVNSCMIYAMDL